MEGTCPACGRTVTIVNYQPATRNLPELGYLGGHQRPGTRPGTKCTASFGTWLERRPAGSEPPDAAPDEVILTDGEVAEIEADLFEAIRADKHDDEVLLNALLDGARRPGAEEL